MIVMIVVRVVVAFRHARCPQGCGLVWAVVWVVVRVAVRVVIMVLVMVAVIVVVNHGTTAALRME